MGVDEDHTGNAAHQALPQDRSRLDHRTTDRAAIELALGQESDAGIEVQGTDDSRAAAGPSMGRHRPGWQHEEPGAGQTRSHALRPQGPRPGRNEGSLKPAVETRRGGHDPGGKRRAHVRQTIEERLAVARAYAERHMTI